MNGEAHGTGQATDGRRNMSTTSPLDPEAGMPLTRRQRRALERAQQAQQEAATQDLPALSQPAVQTRPAGTVSPGTRTTTGTPAPRTELQPQPQRQPRTLPQPQELGSSHDRRNAHRPSARTDRRDHPHEPGYNTQAANNK